MIKVLFVCVHNAARSQMAEAYLIALGKGYFQAESAGLEPGVLNPDIIKVMAEDGYDLSLNRTKSVFDFYKEGKRYHYVVKVCDAINGQKCPIFPSTLETLEWNHEDPASFTGSEEDRLSAARKIRDDIKKNVQDFVDGILLSEVRAKSDDLNWMPTQDPVGYRLSSILHESEEEIGVSRSWLNDSNYMKQAGWIEALVNLFYLEFGKAMISELKQETFTQAQLEGWMRTIIKHVGLNPAKTIDIHQFENIVHAHYEANLKHVRLMTHSLNYVQTQQVLVDMLMKAIQDKRLVIWLGHEDAGILVGVDGNEDGPLNLHVLRKGQIESRSITDWISQASEHDALVLLERK